MTWNLFHGRDHPPEAGLFGWRSRLLGRSQLGSSYAQLNEPLLDRFAELLAGWRWDVALLQETPPRWLRPLALRCRAGAAGALTSRNLLPSVRAALADRNPDLMASAEGGSNVTLVRAPRRIVEVERVTLARRPERRRLLLVRTEAPDGARLVVANVHLSVPATGHGPAEVETAASKAVSFAGQDPLLFGGDLNLRPAREPEAFAALREEFGLAPPTSPHAIDHLLARGLAVSEPPAPLAPAGREVEGPRGLRVRLSDHAPVTASFGMR